MMETRKCKVADDYFVTFTLKHRRSLSRLPPMDIRYNATCTPVVSTGGKGDWIRSHPPMTCPCLHIRSIRRPLVGDQLVKPFSLAAGKGSALGGVSCTIHPHQLTGLIGPMIVTLVVTALSVAREREAGKGNSVRIGDGPAAVTGDERCIDVTDHLVGKTRQVG
jgi:hypothetical protein